jgi:23S rRNA (cytidine1920-2'-O)/16S rRNA (cytidine1409-2'-O)-methyltransferase
VLSDVKIERVCPSEYVSLGGFKLEKALKDFNYEVKGLVVADIGASTGGFTDCLIKNGAKKVYAVDLRDDLLHESLKIRDDVDLVVKNAKELQKSDFCDNLDLIVADLSFISVSHVLGVFNCLIQDEKDVIILIKPQFETGRKEKHKNGMIVRVRLSPNSSSCSVNGIMDAADGHKLLKISVNSVPEKGKANKELIEFIAKKLKLPKSTIERNARN